MEAYVIKQGNGFVRGVEFTAGGAAIFPCYQLVEARLFRTYELAEKFMLIYDIDNAEIKKIGFVE